MHSERLKETIARAIKAADRSILNEDYGKQAAAVIKALNQSGYEIIPAKPNMELIEHINENLPIGRLRPKELVGVLYSLIITSARKFDR